MLFPPFKTGAAAEGCAAIKEEGKKPG